jgi:GR25 family glycosyltransferase involved in LPS biosynthesis
MQTVDSYFDRIFLINLDRRPDRWAESQKELAMCGIEKCQRLPAVGGPCDSHTVLWEELADGKLENRLLVFEDDFMLTTREVLLKAGYQPTQEEVVIFDSCPGATLEKRFGVMIDEVPESWDLLYLGGGYECEPRCRVRKHVIRNRGMLTTHAYAMSRKFARRLCESRVYIGNVDSILAEWSKKDDVYSYTLSPRLFIQRPSSPSARMDPPPPIGFPWDQTDSRHEKMV